MSCYSLNQYKSIKKIEDVVDSLRNSIRAYILDIYVSDDFLYTVWKINDNNKDIVYSDLYVFQKYNLATEELVLERKLTPDCFKGYTLDCYLFDPKTEEISCILSNSKKTKCQFYKL